MKLNSLFTLVAITFLSLTAFAQTGTVRGTVIDGTTGEPLFMANVAIPGTTTGTSTDFDGKFELELAPGTHELQFSFIGLAKVSITDIQVEANKVTVVDVVKLMPSSQQLKTYTITAKANRDSETAIMTMKKKSVKMLDGISAKKMALAGDGSAVEAAQRVTGVSIEGGKYVYVRGLGDRYTMVTINDIRIPGLDPDRNSVQMDLFPTSLIDNIVVAKNFTADLPADFTGGLVNIETKSFPDEKIMEVSLGVSYNPDMHFNSDFLTYGGGDLDFLGFDDGTRELPTNARNPDNFPRIIRDPEAMKEMTSQFDPQLGTETTTSLLDYSLGFSMGNQKKLRDDENSPTLGYIFSLNYKQTQTHYDNITYAEYQRNIDKSENELIYADRQDGIQSSQRNLIGALGGIAYKTKKNQYKLTLMHIQSGEKRAALLQLDQNTNAVGKSGYIGESDNLEYEQRSLTNLLFNGIHNLPEKDIKIDWSVSPTLSIANDPDIRKTAFTFAVDTSFQAGNAGVPLRLWRELNEYSVDNQVNFTKKYKFKEEDAKLQAGAAFLYKARDYEINSYALRFLGNQDWKNNDPNEVLLPENIYPNSNNQGTYMVNENNNPNSNAYEAQAFNYAGYVSNEFQVTKSLRSIIGVRAEYFLQKHTGRDIAGSAGNGGNVLDNETVLETFDLFPTVNLIQGFKNDLNLRFAYARTVARPSFKELSFAQIVDPLTGRTFNGGLFQYPPDWDGNLTSTYIHNIDLRFEKFLPKGQLYSISAFYKKFIDPIELVRNPLINTSFDYQPRNVGDGQIFGIELEARKNLMFISPLLANYSFSGNVTFVQSSIEMATNEFEARKNNARDGEDIEDTREMAGQAPYVINAGFEYSHYEKGINAGLFYNVKGPTLLIVGTGFVPDIYQEQFHSLNFGISKTFGKEKNLKVDFQAANILGDVREELFISHEAEDQVFTSYEPGRTFSAGISFKF